MLLDPKPALSEKAGSDDSAKYGLKITEERISIKTHCIIIEPITITLSARESRVLLVGAVVAR